MTQIFSSPSVVQLRFMSRVVLNQWVGSTCVLLFAAREPPFSLRGGSQHIAQLVKKLPAMQKTQVRSLGQEDPLEKEMATLSSILAWRTPWIEEPGGLRSNLEM